MNERIIEIILYLISQLRRDSSIEHIDVRELTADGYTDAEIGAAYSWLVDRESFGEYEGAHQSGKSFRVLHDSVKRLFRPEAYGYLLQLVAIGMISEMEFEVLISRAQLAGYEPLMIRDVKALVAMLLAEKSDAEVGGSRFMVSSNDTVH